VRSLEDPDKTLKKALHYERDVRRSHRYNVERENVGRRLATDCNSEEHWGRDVEQENRHSRSEPVVLGIHTQNRAPHSLWRCC